MKVKELKEMLELADENSEVVFDLRDKESNSCGFFPIHSNWQENGGYDPDELDYFGNKEDAKVELCMLFTDNAKAKMVQMYELSKDDEFCYCCQNELDVRNCANA